MAGPDKFDGFRSSDARASRITSRAKPGFYSGMEMLLPYIIHVYLLVTVHVKLVLGLGSPVVLWSASGPRSNSSVRCPVNRSPKYVLKINQNKENVLKSFKRLVTDSDAFRES